MMWEEMRAEVDRATRDAELAREHWYDREFRMALRRDPESFLKRFRLFRQREVVRPPRREGIPLSWRLRGASLRGPVL